MGHIFDRVCREHGIEHRLTKPCHPWTNGQAERMNRAVKEATTEAFHHPDLAALKAHVLAFVTARNFAARNFAARNFAKHLEALRWRTPFQAIRDAWTQDPSVLRTDPLHLLPGPNT
jgi:transposase InsO family protein